MPVTTEIPGVTTTEVELFKHTLEEHGFDFSQIEREAKMAEEKLTTMDRTVQSAMNFAFKPLTPELRPLDAGTLHAAAKSELDNCVEVLIDLPIPSQQPVWNAGELATIPVEIRSAYLALNDVVVEMRFTGPAVLLPIPTRPPLSANKRYFAHLEPCVSQRMAFLARALPASQPQQVSLTMSVILSAEVVPYATRYPATRIVQIWP
jgi:hypothetical protein